MVWKVKEYRRVDHDTQEVVLQDEMHLEVHASKHLGVISIDDEKTCLYVTEDNVEHALVSQQLRVIFHVIDKL